MFVLANMWFQTLMRQFFFNIDKIVFGFISTLYDLLITIARTSVLSQADIMSIADRIYKLLAVFMVFKVTFSLIMYVVNPDDFSDKSKGVGKLGLNIAFSLAILVLTPYIFNYAYQLQTIVLEDNSLANLVFGKDDSSANTFDTAGSKIAYMTMEPFFMPDISLDELYECAQLTTGLDGESGNLIFNSACSGMDSNMASTDDPDSLYALLNKKFTEQDLKNYVGGVELSNFGLMFRQDLAVATVNDNKDYVIDYKYLFSTLVGIVVVLVLISFCMDVAIRSIKLAFLQLIAPIPIISYVDPKSGKDGLFKKWYQMCFKTYISIFVRLIALYFAVHIISKINNLVDIVDGSYVSNLFVKVFIIIGALMFAKQLPKILEGLGLKLDGGFTLNPLKKIENEALGGKQISKAAKVPFKYAGRGAKGLATAGLVGGAALVTGQGLRGMGHALGGAMKGEKFGKNFSGSYSAARARKKQVQQMKNDGISPWNVRGENIKNVFRGLTPKDQLDDLNSSIKRVQDNYKSYYNGVLGADKLAKEFERRRLAAENAGDDAGMKLWQDSIDARVKEIEQNGGHIMLGDDANVSASIANKIKNNGGTYSGNLSNEAQASNATAQLNKASITESSGLQSIRENTTDVVNYINQNYDGKFGYNGSLDASADMKKVNGTAKGAELDVSNSKDTKRVTDMSKYTTQSSKKS